jgi:hypothetical protein
MEPPLRKLTIPPLSNQPEEANLPIVMSENFASWFFQIEIGQSLTAIFFPSSSGIVFLTSFLFTEAVASRRGGNEVRECLYFQFSWGKAWLGMAISEISN